MTEDEATEEAAAMLGTIGWEVLLFIGTAKRLHHETAVGTLGYMHPRKRIVVLDLVHWATQAPGWEEARDRLFQYLEDRGVDKLIAELHGERLKGALPS